MGAKHYGDAQHDRQEILNVVGAAILLGEGLTVTVPPAESPPSAHTTHIYWGDEAFAGDHTDLMVDGRVMATSFEPAAYQAVLQVIREYERAVRGSSHVMMPSELRAALDGLTAVLGGEDG